MITPGTVIESLSLDVRGYRFDALAAGPSDGEPVILLHGFPEFADAWVPVLQAMGAAGFRVLTFDQRGYSPGARPAAQDDYATDELVEDVLAVADAIAAPRFHLVGHDWGGAVAWRTAAHHGTRLLSLAILSTPHTDALLEAKASDPDQHRRSAYIDFFRQPGHVAEQTLLADDATRLRAVYQDRLPAEQVQRYVQRFSQAGALTAAINWYRAMDQDPIGPIRVRTLYIWGTGDQALGRTAAEATARHIEAPYTFLALQGRSHWLLEEAPEELLPPLLRHLRGAS